MDDDEIHTKFSIYNLGGPALLCEAREEDLLATSSFTENGSYTVVIARQSTVQWSLTIIIGLVHICLRAQQSLHHLQVPILGGPVQWSLTTIIGLVHICLRAQQSLHHLQVPITGRPIQWSLTILSALFTSASAPSRACTTSK
jgi:hypothetical protein